MLLGSVHKNGVRHAAPARGFLTGGGVIVSHSHFRSHFSRKMRPPFRCERCAEVFIDGHESGTASSADEALAGSSSILLVDGVASLEECEALCEAASAAATRTAAAREGGPTHDADGMRLDGRRIRGPINELLTADSQGLCDSLLCRALARVDAMMPSLRPRLFGNNICLPLTTLLHNANLVFSPGEPAVNIYSTGGGFDPHTDKQSLTILVALSAPRDESQPSSHGEFEGGGTAFWSRHAGVAHATDEETREARASSVVEPTHRGKPTLVVRPPPGTAVVFGGQLMHAAEPVSSGVRCMLVASFSAKVLVSGDDELRSRWSTPVFRRR